jgi:hypothetical protein
MLLNQIELSGGVMNSVGLISKNNQILGRIAGHLGIVFHLVMGLSLKKG